MEDLLNHILKGDQQAVSLCIGVFHWANEYDDIVDGDVGLTSDETRQKVHNSTWFLVNEMPNNQFFKAHRDELLVSMSNAVSSWRIANTLQRSNNPKAHEVAHVLRWVPIEFFLHCARIIGGEDWVQEIGPWFWIEMTKRHSFEQFARECGG